MTTAWTDIMVGDVVTIAGVRYVVVELDVGGDDRPFSMTLMREADTRRVTP